MTASTERHRIHNEAQRAYFEGRRELPRMRPTDSPYLRRQVEQSLRAAEARPGERVLEVGCGMGRYTLALARQGFRLEALDLSGVLLDRLRAAGGQDLPLHEGDLLDPPRSLEGRFDLVLGYFVLHHIDDLEACFAAVASLLAPSGRAVFVEPNPYNPLYYVQILATPGMTWAGDGGIVNMRPKRMAHAMRSGGLDPRPPLRFGFFPPFLANRPWASPLERALESFRPWRSCLPFQIFRGNR